MKAYVSQFKSWWSGISRKERSTISIAATFIGLIIIYYFLVSPLYTRVTFLGQQVKNNQDLLSWMKPRIALLQGKSFSRQDVTPSNLLSIVDKNIKSSTLASSLVDITQSGSNGVQLRFKAVAFDGLLNWLASQWVEYGIQVTEMTATKGKTLGITDVTLILRVQ